ncbi:MAG: hypothetical protein WC401_08720 [Bacteroidales bacterium]|jgi:hypothetical protein|nr:hypothetical protein [Bacteroidales bacterium]
MEKKLVLLCIAALILFAFGCKQKSEKNSGNIILSKNIEYDVTINNFKMSSQLTLEESNLIWFRDNIEASSRGAFLDMLFKNAFSGKLNLTDLNGKSIDTNQLKSILYVADTVTLTRITPPYDNYDTIIKKMISISTVTGLRFRESWSYDTKTMEITKKVITMAPLFSKVDTDKDGNEIIGENKVLFWIIFPEKTTPSKVLTKRIVSQVAYHDNSAFKNFNIDSVAIDTYIQKILELAYSDTLSVYSWSDGDMADIQISGTDLKNDICLIDTISFMTPKHKHGNYDTIIKHEPNITAIRFLEEWTFDPATMAIAKKVVGVCPVEMCYDQYGDLKGYRPLFWVYFSDVWIPFDEKLELKKAKK